MLRIVNCIALEHDYRLVLLAAIICFLSCFVTVALVQRAQSCERLARRLWLGAAGFSTGFGIWSTHFIAMLAYNPGMVMGYEVYRTLISLAVAIIVTTMGIVVGTASKRRSAALAGGMLLTGGIFVMHYMGMSALEIPGTIEWDYAYVAASFVAGAIFSSLALLGIAGGARNVAARWRVTILMMLGVVALHFTGMAGVTVVSGPMDITDDTVVSPVLMAVLIAAVAFSLLFVGLIAVVFARQAENAVSAGTRQLAMFVQGVTDYAIYMLDADGRVENWNVGAERSKGYTAKEIVGEHFSRFYSAEEQAAGLPQLALDVARETGKYETEGWRYRKDGSRFWAHVVIDTIRDSEGDLAGYVKITKDITKEKADADRIAEVTKNLDLALENMAQGLCLFDADERLVLSNKRFSDLFGFSADTFKPGITLASMVDLAVSRVHDDPEVWQPRARDIYARHRKLIRQPGGGSTVEQLSSGLSVQMKYNTLADGSWVATYEDITDRLRTEEQIAHMARHDGLTQLPNRASFNVHLEGELESARRSGAYVAVIGIDLDKFKEVNDTHGHAVGDEVLKILSQRMQDMLTGDEAVARFGGDEFAASKRFDDMAELNDFLMRLEKALHAEVKVGSFELKPGASLGVAIFPQDAMNVENLLSNADLAMYRAKEALTRTVCFYEVSMDDVARRRRMMANDLWLAVERGELQLHYQVQKSVKGGETTGYEVLLRWRHPDRGTVSPAEFIPVAEECGAILSIGEWVLREACREAASWPLPHKIAVNLSPVQLANTDVVGLVRDVLAQTGLAPNRLELEITESTIIADKQRALLALRQVKALGVTIAIDDFGTGYSSLETLRSFPFDKIKLDRSFMNEIEDSPQAKAIIRAILALGRSLDVPVLAEGVETGRQLDILLKEGCDEAQGYFLGRPAPMTADEVREDAHIGKGRAA
ncbi:EAL domain-containing protein [Sinorhizobium sp. BG8]|uniref:bifunctional diguanylate cyclase/phosphodiesterase n=1 Tax=Sinorhizobium sp. BG8 TaxID=2613773 RepID=UPI00193E60A8|nr:EAL domain-containing protein [Sinorhizobium sp. BG8]QRM54461.1 EAL domain-containing protein [Sinorhizobium sp. BG8]